MGKVILDMSMSLDGFIGNQKQKYIYPIEEIKKTPQLKQLIKNAGAVIMDIEAYDLSEGDFTDYEYQVPVFVICKKAPAKTTKGTNENLKFHFITTGIESAVEKAKTAAKSKNVMVIGLAEAAQESLKAQKIDELIIRIIPVLLGKGVRLFENLGKEAIPLKILNSEKYLAHTDITFKIQK
ncbi:riboflavin biosynthesis protein RibD [Sphingobacteriaceae bacterium]|nr:riboflavin biosynthesis protein RibD [Sphingobacteriaceae bacterium]